MSTLEQPIEQLRQRVDSLEIASRDRQRPWYLQASSLLSLVAILISGATTVYTQLHTNQETIRSKKEELRKLAIGLVEIRQESMKSASMPGGEGNQLLKAKQGVYLQAAERLVQEIPSSVSSYEYALLATEHASDGNYAAAKSYLVRSADAATTPTQRAQALRILAMIYFTPGSLRNLDQGRAAFAKAIDTLTGDSDPYLVSSKCLTYEAWAAMERQNQASQHSSEKTELARKCYNDLPPQYPGRQQLLDDLDRRIASGQGTSSPQISIAQSNFSKNMPVDVRRVLANTSSETLLYVINNDISQLISESQPESPEKEVYAELVRAGVCVKLSKIELRAEESKQKEQPDGIQKIAFGLRCGELYDRTRSFLASVVPDVVNRLRQEARSAQEVR